MTLTIDISGKRKRGSAPIDSAPVSSASGYRLSESIVVIGKPSGAAAEAVRSLRTHIMAQHFEKGRRALAVCEPGEGDGASFVAVNLAVALSQVGVNTLLIEGDLRRPELDALIRPPKPAKGLRQYLASTDVQLGDAIQPEVLPNLAVMYAGGSVGADAAVQELLGSARFRDLMTVCLREYDATIIDTPPASRCSDAARVSNVVGYALVVARRNVTLVNDVRTLITELEAHDATVVGTVLKDG